MVRIAVVRHGEKQYTSGFHERDWGLRPDAREDAGRLRAALVSTHGAPDVVLTSKWRHAVETAAALAGTPPVCRVVELVGLTPFTADAFFTPPSILGEVRAAGIALAGIHLMIVVAHHNRTMQIAAALSGVTGMPEIQKLEAVVLQAPSLRAFLRGRGVLIDRLGPDSDLQ